MDHTGFSLMGVGGGAQVVVYCVYHAAMTKAETLEALKSRDWNYKMEWPDHNHPTIHPITYPWNGKPSLEGFFVSPETTPEQFAAFIEHLGVMEGGQAGPPLSVEIYFDEEIDPQAAQKLQDHPLWDMLQTLAHGDPS